jgi:signal peptide peptidase SppA
VAVIPVYGVISQRMNLFQEISGGTSAELIARDIRAAANDPEVSAILLDVDSPGGSVYGIAELGDVIYQARQQKPVVAIANSLMASAAYWIGSQASEVVVTPGGEAGSIGVITAHEDYSPLIEDRKLPAVELIYAGQYKAEGNPYQPLDDEARAAIQARVDEYYAMFVDAVARGRGVPAQAVREGFGQGRVLGAQGAVDAGLVDRIATFDDVLGELVQSGGGAEAGMNRRRKRALAARRELEAQV